MNILGSSSAAALYASIRSTSGHQVMPNAVRPEASGGASGATASTQVTLSEQARALASSDRDNIASQLAHDPQLADIAAKDPSKRTAEDIDYMQKAGGFVNTMATLSPGEKKLYDELVAQGNTEAVQGMNMLALSRMGGGETKLPDGTTFDPNKTAITADNVRQLFSKAFGTPDSKRDAAFEALAKYLDTAQA